LPDGGGDGAASRPGIPLPRALAAYAREPLIGRDREIAALREATAPRHGCRVALVLGEPGIGKTRHAAAAAADAQARGAAVKDATNVRRTAQQYCRSPRAGKPQHRSRGDQVDSPESLV